MVEWASKLTLKDVVLTKDGIDVETLGVQKWADLTCYIKQAFLQSNNIAIHEPTSRTLTLERMWQMKLVARDTDIK